MIYHLVLNLIFKKINDSKPMFYIKKRPTLSVFCFGLLIPILSLFLIYKFDEYKYSGCIIAFSILYSKYFFNYKIFNR